MDGEMSEEMLVIATRISKSLAKQHAGYYDAGLGFDDLKQVGLMGAIIGFRAYDPAKGASLPTVIFTYARNAMRYELRQVSRERPSSTVQMPEKLDPATEEPEGLSPDEERMQDAVETLPRDLGGIIDMLFVEGISQADAARRLGVSVSTVSRRKLKALALIEEAYEG